MHFEICSLRFTDPKKGKKKKKKRALRFQNLGQWFSALRVSVMLEISILCGHCASLGCVQHVQMLQGLKWPLYMSIPAFLKNTFGYAVRACFSIEILATCSPFFNQV